MADSHIVRDSASLYLCTPVILVSSLNENGSSNLAPASSAFWLGARCVLGLSANSKTSANIARNGQLVLNLPSEKESRAINRLQKLTGMHPVPPEKLVRGYISEHRKFEIAGLTPEPSQIVSPPRVLECPIQLEATVVREYGAISKGTDFDDPMMIFEVGIQLLHVHPDVLAEGDMKRIDPNKWQPIVSTYRQLSGLSQGRIRKTRLNHLVETPERPLNPELARKTFRLVK
jgi:flavin reductase (DIM6/NTAB) family NADH-FMN oxidoreductase RutF